MKKAEKKSKNTACLKSFKKKLGTANFRRYGLPPIWFDRPLEKIAPATWFEISYQRKLENFTT